MNQQQEVQNYTEVPTSEDPVQNDKPPSYFNVIGQIKAAQSETENPASLAVKTYQIITQSLFCSCSLLLMSILPGFQLHYGLNCLDHCPVKEKIPVWLIVTGICGLISAGFKVFIDLYTYIKLRKNKSYKGPRILSYMHSLLSLFILVWFIFGNVWVYGVRGIVSHDQANAESNYCEKRCYLLAFWSITLAWIILGLFCGIFCLCFCLACGFAACLSGLNKAEQNNNAKKNEQNKKEVEDN